MSSWMSKPPTRMRSRRPGRGRSPPRSGRLSTAARRPRPRVQQGRTDQLAAFADVAEGRAWERRHYNDAFDGLRSLPLQATIREALERDPETARAALAQLAAERRLESVLAALGEREGERVAVALARGGTVTAAGGRGRARGLDRVLGTKPGRSPSLPTPYAWPLPPGATSFDPPSLSEAARALVALAAARAVGEAGSDPALQALARLDPAYSTQARS